MKTKGVKKISGLKRTQPAVSQCDDGCRLAAKKSFDYYSNLRPEIAELIQGAPEKILEIGCAKGFFRLNVTWTCEYWGVEIIPEIAREAEQRLSVVLTGAFDEVYDKLPDCYFNLVLCNDVIEHMHDTDGFLKKIKRKMAIGAQLIGSVPNVRYVLNLYELLVRKDWHYSKAGILDETHLRFFTAKSIAWAVEQAGFKIDCIVTVNLYVYSKCFMKYALNFLSLLLGRDIMYFQIGFRAIWDGSCQVETQT